MNIDSFMEIMTLSSKLKDTTRHCVTPKNRTESVAEHSWRLSLMAYFVKDEFPEADINKVIKMCLIHDIGEAFTGDIPAFCKKQSDENNEEQLLNEWCNSLPAPFDTELSALYKEMYSLESTEAKIYKALDNMEAVLSHNEAPLSSWIDTEYTLNITYGEDKVAFSEYMKALKKRLNEDSVKKIENGK